MYHIAINKHKNDEGGCLSGMKKNERMDEREIEKPIPSIVIPIKMKHQK